MGVEPNSAPIRRGTRANQPAAYAVPVGTLYYVVSEGVTERSNGAVWEGFSDTGGGGSALAIKDEGVSKTAAAISINFVGAGVTAAADGSGNATVTIPGPSSVPTPTVVSTQAGTNYNVDPADQGNYIRLTNVAAKTVTVRPESTQALTTNGEWHFRNVGAGTATIVEGAGVTVNPPVGGTLTVAQGGTVTLKRVSADLFDLIGATIAP